MKNTSAFPEIKTEYNESTHEYTNNIYSTGGMTLRDYFAAKAMQSFLTGLNEDQFDEEGIAIMAYKMADAMLKARGE